MNIFLGMKILWIFFGGHNKKSDNIYVSCLCILGSFFWGGGGGAVLEIPIFFFFGGGGVAGRCWARAYVWRKYESTPPPPWGWLHGRMAGWVSMGGQMDVIIVRQL